jgi:uncharacterized protein (DUF488 family)
MKPGRAEVWSIGHWTCPEATFVRFLRSQEIDMVVDVRASPGSTRSPQFNREPMSRWLEAAGIGYRHLSELGGRRPAQAVDDVQRNAGWQNSSFKNYADYTMTPAYQHGIERLIALASDNRVAFLCGEPMPWRCHRLIISNTLVARGWIVRHILGDAEPRVHELGRWGATPVPDGNGVLTYPAADGGE